jgi:hypothetical protein
MMNLRVASSGRDAEKSREALFPQDTIVKPRKTPDCAKRNRAINDFD